VETFDPRILLELQCANAETLRLADTSSHWDPLLPKMAGRIPPTYLGVHFYVHCTKVRSADKKYPSTFRLDIAQ
jgi:hypothetical protein